MDISCIPNVKRNIGLIALFTLIGVALMAVNMIAGGLTPIKLTLFFLVLGVDGLMVLSLYDALNPEKRARGLGILAVTSRVLAIGLWVLFGICALVTLLMLFAALTLDERLKEMWSLCCVMLILLALLYARIRHLGWNAKVAKQLKAGSYQPVRAPETWALVCAASSLAYLLLQASLYFFAAPAPTGEQELSFRLVVWQLSDLLAGRDSGSLPRILGYLSSAVGCANLYVIHLLLKSVRISAPLMRN